MGEVRNGDQKVRKYLFPEIFYGRQEVHKYFCTSVEGTTYNHGRPEGISEDQHPMNQFLGMLYGQVRP